MGIPIYEQETVIRYGRGEDFVTVHTTDSTTMTKLDKLADNPDSDWTLSETWTVDGEVVEKMYKAPKALVSFRTARVSRQLTDEQKQALADRLKAYRSNT